MNINIPLDLSSIEQAIKRAIESAQPDFVGYADVKEFSKISGISPSDLEKKVLSDRGFKKFIYRFENSNKRYIKVKPALQYIESLMIAEG